MAMSLPTGRYSLMELMICVAARQLEDGKTVVIGGGQVGCETADYLCEQGNKVILVEILPEIAMAPMQIPKPISISSFEKGLLRFTPVQRPSA
jgi:NADPH-dependent 2,4-dienoyl-CoA reductase/sulfur reductase-like enzyme